MLPTSDHCERVKCIAPQKCVKCERDILSSPLHNILRKSSINSMKAPKMINKGSQRRHHSFLSESETVPFIPFLIP